MSMTQEYAFEYNRRPTSREQKRAYKTTPRGKYQKQMERAKARGIEWNFTYEEWIAWWGEDWSLRGRKPHQLVMARIGDIGPYSPDNCRKQGHCDNLHKRSLTNVE